MKGSKFTQTLILERFHKMDYAKAIDILRPSAEWRRSTNYDELKKTWKDSRSLPTDLELKEAYNQAIALEETKANQEIRDELIWNQFKKETIERLRQDARI